MLVQLGSPDLGSQDQRPLRCCYSNVYLRAFPARLAWWVFENVVVSPPDSELLAAFLFTSHPFLFTELMSGKHSELPVWFSHWCPWSWSSHWLSHQVKLWSTGKQDQFQWIRSLKNRPLKLTCCFITSKYFNDQLWRGRHCRPDRQRSVAPAARGLAGYEQVCRRAGVMATGQVLEAMIWISAAPLVYCVTGDKGCNLSRDSPMRFSCGKHEQSWALHMGPAWFYGSTALSHLRCPCLFTAFRTPGHTQQRASKFWR